MFFKTVLMAMALIVVILGAFLVEAVLRDRAYTSRLLLGMAGVFALGGATALICSLVNI